MTIETFSHNTVSSEQFVQNFLATYSRTDLKCKQTKYKKNPGRKRHFRKDRMMKSPAKINHYISLEAINTLVQSSQLLFCFPAGWCSFPRVSCAACCAGSCKVVKEQSAVILLRCCSSVIVPPPSLFYPKKGTSTHVLHSQHELKYAVLIALSLVTTAADQTNVDRRTTVCLRCDLTASTLIYNPACFFFCLLPTCQSNSSPLCRFNSTYTSTVSPV